MMNYKFVPRDDGLFKRNYFEQKNDQEFSLFLAPHPEEAQLISLDGRRRKGRKPSQGCPGFCRRAENYEKRPKLRPTMNINPRLIQLLCQSQLYNLKKRRRRKMWYDDQNKATKRKARVWELCVDLAFSLTWCRLSGLVRSKPPPPSFSDLTNRHQPSNTYFRRKVGKPPMVNMSFIQICLIQAFGHQPSVGPGQVFIWSYSLPASGTSQHQFRFLAKKVGPQWTNMDQSGPKWTNMDQKGPRRSNLQRLLIVRSVHSVQSSPRPPPKKLPCSRWSALKIILPSLSSLSSLSSMITSSDMILRPLSICDHLLDCLVTFPQLGHVLRHVCTFIPDHQH